MGLRCGRPYRNAHTATPTHGPSLHCRLQLTTAGRRPTWQTTNAPNQLQLNSLRILCAGGVVARSRRRSCVVAKSGPLLVSPGRSWRRSTAKFRCFFRECCTEAAWNVRTAFDDDSSNFPAGFHTASTTADRWPGDGCPQSARDARGRGPHRDLHCCTAAAQTLCAALRQCRNCSVGRRGHSVLPKRLLASSRRPVTGG